jgi:hypothetical protein
MKMHRQKRTSERIGQIQLLRMRVAAAESNLKQAKETLGQAKRRRKLARLLAKRAKKDAKQAKINLAEIREALAQAVAKATAEARLASRPEKSTTKSAAKSRVASRKKPAARRRKVPASLGTEQTPTPAPSETAVGNVESAAPQAESAIAENPSTS